MAARAMWKGYLRLSLVTVPVKAYAASGGESAPIQLNQLHRECHNRIRYQKTCPVHGQVSQQEIVSGYQYAKDRYVVIDEQELKKLRPEGDHSIEIDTFIPADSLDPAYFSGKTYYLLPDGSIGKKPYHLIYQSLVEDQLHAVAQVVMSNREHLVLIRPMDKLLAMSDLQYKSDIRDPKLFEDELDLAESAPAELKLTRQLINGMVDADLDFGKYQNRYYERLSELVQAKVDGHELVTAPRAAEPKVINLVEALKASLLQIPTSSGAKKVPATRTKPKPKIAASERRIATKKPKRKTG